MFFEGSEKKFEIVTKDQRVDFSREPLSFWQEMISQCKATILSSIENDQLKAFLLSESSLFIWKNRIILITCGRTKLINALVHAIKHFGPENICELFFQRKNEYFSHLQPSHFISDVQQLSQFYQGKAYRFGNMDEHHNFLYCVNSNCKNSEKDQTYELHMYHISVQSSEFLTTPGHVREDLRQYLKISQWAGDFIIDDFVFEPYGYSLNGIKGDEYITIHITPQENSSFVSFEGNINLKLAVPILLEIFSPLSFDLISFETESCEDTIFSQLNSYKTKQRVTTDLATGHRVIFSHYYRPQTEIIPPYMIDMQEIENLAPKENR